MIDNSFTKEEINYYRRHKKLIDVMVSSLNILQHSGTINGNCQIAISELENALGKDFARKLLFQKFWKDVDNAKKFDIRNVLG